METKSLFKSTTVVSALVALLGFVANFFHVSVADLLPALSANLGAYVNDTLTLAGLVSAIIGRFRAVQPLHVFTKTIKPAAGFIRISGAVSILIAAAVAISVVSGLTGCGGQGNTPAPAPTPSGTTGTTTPTGTTTSSGSSILSAALPYLAQAAGIGSVTATVELEGGKAGGPTKPQLASDFLTLGSAGYTAASSGTVTVAQMQAIFASFKSDASTTAYDAEATALANDVVAFAQAHPNVTLSTILTNYFYGVQLAAQALGGTSTSATLYNTRAPSDLRSHAETKSPAVMGSETAGVRDAYVRFDQSVAVSCALIESFADNVRAVRLGQPPVIYEMAVVARDDAGRDVYSF